MTFYDWVVSYLHGCSQWWVVGDGFEISRLCTGCFVFLWMFAVVGGRWWFCDFPVIARSASDEAIQKRAGWFRILTDARNDG
jgi:hypothetical protein